MRGVRPIAMRFERRPRGPKRLHGAAQIARDERDLGFGDRAPCAGRRLLRTEGARGASQQLLRARQIAELRHRDAAQRERRRIVAQRDPLQRAERIARFERTRRGRDQRVHRNPVTLVTLTRSIFRANLISRPAAGWQRRNSRFSSRRRISSS